MGEEKKKRKEERERVTKKREKSLIKSLCKLMARQKWNREKPGLYAAQWIAVGG